MKYFSRNDNFFSVNYFDVVWIVRGRAPFRSTTSGRRPLTTRRCSFHVTHVAKCHVVYGDARDNDEGLEESAYYIRRVGGKKKPSKRKRALCINDDTRKERRARLSLSLSFSTPSLPLFRPSFIPLSSLCETRRPPLLAQRGTTTKRHEHLLSPLFLSKKNQRLTTVVRASSSVPGHYHRPVGSVGCHEVDISARACQR